MVLRRQEGALTAEEKRIIKALLEKGWRNQDIQALVNIGRPATINGARVTEVKKSATHPASAEALDFFLLKKKSYDPQSHAISNATKATARDASPTTKEAQSPGVMNYFFEAGGFGFAVTGLVWR